MTSTAGRKQTMNSVGTSSEINDDEDEIRKIEDSEDGRSESSSFSAVLRRRNNADDGEDEEFQRVEDPEMEEGIERMEGPEEFENESEGEMVKAV
jgi:hypothetical protein